MIIGVLSCKQIVNKKKKKRKTTSRIANFVVPVDHRLKLKESEKGDKYLDLARELKKQWDMGLMMIPIVIYPISTVTKGLIQRLEDLEIRGRVETIQMKAWSRSTRILRNVLETWGNLLSVKLQWETTSWWEKLDETNCHINCINLARLSGKGYSVGITQKIRISPN